MLIEQPPVSIDPRFCIQASDFKVSRMVYAPLVSTDTQTLEAKMELAESVTPSGNDWDITLRDARFSDGARMAVERGKRALLRDDWRRVFEPDEVMREVRAIIAGIGATGGGA